MAVSVTAGAAGCALGVGETPVTTADGNPYTSLISRGGQMAKTPFIEGGGNSKGGRSGVLRFGAGMGRLHS